MSWKKASKKKETRIKMEIVDVLQQASYPRQRSGGWNSWLWPDINVIICYASCVLKVNFQEFNLCAYIKFELPSAFLNALCELLEEQAVLCGNNRSSRPVVFCKKGVLRNFVKFTGNTCTRNSFLIKLQAWPATLSKKNLWHRCFPVNFAKFPRTPFFYRTPQVDASKIIVLKKIRDSLTNFTFSV